MVSIHQILKVYHSVPCLTFACLTTSMFEVELIQESVVYGVELHTLNFFMFFANFLLCTNQLSLFFTLILEDAIGHWY
jgi:hypothetical protein